MTAQALLKGTCAHNTARQFWRKQLDCKRNYASARTYICKCSAVREVQRSLRSKERSACVVLEQYLHRLDSTEPTYHSFLTTDAATARVQAKALDQQIAQDGTSSLRALAGIPIAIKDNICTKGLETTAGSKILQGYRPPFDATAVARLKAAGAIIIGKTNMDAFGMGSSSEYSDYQVTCNPCDPERVPGGSSGGSAAAVASSQCVAALGSDTGGSIRQPASFCGVVGLKPTYGRISRYGLIAYGSSLDCIGPLSSTVEDAAIMLGVMAGQDPHDATSSAAPVTDFAAALPSVDSLNSKPLKGKRIGVIAEMMQGGVAPGVMSAVQNSIKHLESLGADVSEISLPQLDLALPAYYVLAVSEASSNLARYDGVRYGLRHPAANLRSMYNGTRQEGFGEEMKRRILMGTYALSAGYYDAYYKKAQQVRTLVQQAVNGALQQYDLLLSPVAPTTAFKIGEKSEDPLSMYKEDLMTVHLNLAGLPGISIPCGYESGSNLPVGLQLIAPAFGEEALLATAHIFEQTVQLQKAE